MKNCVWLLALKFHSSSFFLPDWILITMQMKIPHKEYYRQHEILFHVCKQEVLWKKAYLGNRSSLPLHCTVFCYFSLYTDCFEPLTINKGFPASGRERGRVDFHNSRLLCVNWEITSSILEIDILVRLWLSTSQVFCSPNCSAFWI